MIRSLSIGLGLLFLFSTAIHAQGKRRPNGKSPRGQMQQNRGGQTQQGRSGGAMSVPENKQAIGSTGIAWYTTWETGLEEAKRSNRPIFFMSAATVCSGVSGVF